jgi:hypothetical protein
LFSISIFEALLQTTPYELVVSFCVKKKYELVTLSLVPHCAWTCAKLVSITATPFTQQFEQLVRYIPVAPELPVLLTERSSIPEYWMGDVPHQADMVFAVDQFDMPSGGLIPTETFVPEQAEPTVVTPLQLVTMTICS